MATFHLLRCASAFQAAIAFSTSAEVRHGLSRIIFSFGRATYPCFCFVLDFGFARQNALRFAEALTQLQSSRAVHAVSSLTVRHAAAFCSPCLVSCAVTPPYAIAATAAATAETPNAL